MRTGRAGTYVHDPFGYASAALGYPVTLAPRGSTTVAITMPLSGAATPPALANRDAGRVDRARAGRTAAAWRRELNDVELDVAAAGQPLVDTLRTALAHLLITRDGPILQPGTRAYARSWIRDGAMIAESLLRLGHADVAADYLRWYATYQFADGKVPCCVDERGADPVPENDSAGEFVFLVDERFAIPATAQLCAQLWPHVRAAMRYHRRPAPVRAHGRAPTDRTPRFSACCPRRSATRAIRRSRCTPTGTTSGR